MRYKLYILKSFLIYILTMYEIYINLYLLMIINFIYGGHMGHTKKLFMFCIMILMVVIAGCSKEEKKKMIHRRRQKIRIR